MGDSILAMYSVITLELKIILKLSFFKVIFFTHYLDRNYWKSHIVQLLKQKAFGVVIKFSVDGWICYA